ncbi:MAG TPA: hypothetical protein VMT68_15010 [Caulobacteraceae bacterium]|nr:hypothetical protein [Caulobacteraceae bacterium]
MDEADANPGETPKPKTEKPTDAREARLAAALRANLRRRKAAARPVPKD